MCLQTVKDVPELWFENCTYFLFALHLLMTEAHCLGCGGFLDKFSLVFSPTFSQILMRSSSGPALTSTERHYEASPTWRWGPRLASAMTSVSHQKLVFQTVLKNVYYDFETRNKKMYKFFHMSQIYDTQIDCM